MVVEVGRRVLTRRARSRKTSLTSYFKLASLIT